MAPWAKSWVRAVTMDWFEVEVGLGLGEVELRLGEVLGDGGLGRGVVSGLRGGVGALVVERGSGEIAVLQRGEQLAGFDVRARAAR